MIKLLLLFLIPLYLHASKILSYNIYDRTDRVDIMITFDTPYEGIIKQSLSDSLIQIKLQDASIESSKTKKLSSKYISSISITPMQGYTQITALVPPSINLQASRTSDAYGLRLRFTATQATKKDIEGDQKQSISGLNELPTKKDTDISGSYYAVIIILIVGIIVLYFLKTKVASSGHRTQKQPSWLFNDNPQSQQQKHVTSKDHTNNVSIRFQKALNDKNSVVMLDFGEHSYLVLMGTNNILLDKFSGDRPVSEEQFNDMLLSRHEELERFLNDPQEPKEYLSAYKEKAASIHY